MNRKSCMLFLMFLLATAPALACNFITGEATSIPAESTAIAAPTRAPATRISATETPSVDYTRYNNDSLGIQFQYPETWELQESDTVITIASDSTLLASQKFDREGAGVIMAIGSADEFEGESLEQALVGAIEEFNFTERDQIVQGPTSTTINGQEGAVAVVEGLHEESGQTLIFYVTLMQYADRALVATGVTLQQYAEQYQPILEIVVNSLVLSEPIGINIGTSLPAAEGAIEYGQTIRGTLRSDNGAAWTFIGVENERVDIKVTPIDEELDITVDVLNSSGESILQDGAVDDAFATEEIRNLLLPANDEYTVLVRGFAQATGDVEVSVDEAGALSFTRNIAVGEVITGTLQADEQDDYAYSSPDDTPVTVEVEPEDDLDIVIEIIGPDGSIIMQEDSAYAREQLTFTPQPERNYLIRVRGFAGANGVYSISLTKGGVPTNNIGSTVRASDRLAEGDESGHDYPFTAMKENTVYAVVAPADDLDVVVEIWNDDTDELEESIDLSYAREEITFIAAETGNYYFKVLGFEGQGGEYTITLNAPSSVIFELAYDDEVEGQFAEPAYVEYVIRLEPNEAVQLQVQPDAETDILLEVLDLDDNQLAGVDDGFSGEPEQLRFSPPSDVTEGGIYIIRISDFFGESGGNFTMTVREG